MTAGFRWFSSPFCTFTCWHSTISKLPRLFSTIHSANSNTNVLQLLSILQICIDWYFSWAKLCLTTGKRQQLLFWNKLLCETWHLHSGFLRQSPMSPSDTRIWARSSKKVGFVSHISMDHLWSISLSHLVLSAISPEHCVFLYSKECQSPFFWGVRLFSWCVHTLPKPQLQASTQPVTCFPECFRLHHSRLTPQVTIQNSAS